MLGTHRFRILRGLNDAVIAIHGDPARQELIDIACPQGYGDVVKSPATWCEGSARGDVPAERQRPKPSRYREQRST